jgi:hypothetical protein
MKFQDRGWHALSNAFHYTHQLKEKKKNNKHYQLNNGYHTAFYNVSLLKRQGEFKLSLSLSALSHLLLLLPFSAETLKKHFKLCSLKWILIKRYIC